MNTRQVHFARSAIRLEFEGERPAQIVNFLFGAIADSGPAAPHRRYRLLDSPAGELLADVDDSPAYRHRNPAEMAGWLLGNVGYHLADRSRGGLLFHAGALAWGERGLILPGTMGAGKTTLTAWLLTRGFDYLSDELVFVPDQSEQIEALARPLNLKRPARPALAGFVDFDSPSAQILSAHNSDLVLPVVLRPANRLSQPALRQIVFPRYRAGSELALERLSAAQTGQALMQCLINARNLPGHGFTEIARLARQTPACRLTYGGFHQLGSAIEALMAGA